MRECDCYYCTKERAEVERKRELAEHGEAIGNLLDMLGLVRTGLVIHRINDDGTVTNIDPKDFFKSADDPNTPSAPPPETAPPQPKAELNRRYPYIGYYTMKGTDNDVGRKFAVNFTAPSTGKVVWTDTIVKLGDESKLWCEDQFVPEVPDTSLSTLLTDWDDEPLTFQEIVDDVLDALASPGAYKPAQPFPSFTKHLAKLQADAMKRSFEARDAALFEQYPFLRQVNDELQRLRAANVSMGLKCRRLEKELAGA